MFSPSLGKQNESEVICAENSARLPEPTELNLKSIKKTCVHHQLYKIPVGIYYSSASGKLYYQSSNEAVSEKLFDHISFLMIWASQETMLCLRLMKLSKNEHVT